MWNRIQGLGGTFSQILSHPVSRRRPLGAFGDWLRWQLGARLAPGPVVVPFVEATVLVAEPGMTGVTGNIYHGLHEFAEMGFLLHFLRPGELFGDIGANVGSWSVLAGGVCGARGFAVEPIENTAIRLERNLAVNRLDGRVRVEKVCVGAADGVAHMTRDRDTTNRIVATASAETVAVPVRTLDALCGSEVPVFLKIDVEGFEGAVLEGGSNTLGDKRLEAMVIEVTGDDAHLRDILGRLRHAGFTPVAYEPETRALGRLGGLNPTNGNTIFVRDVDAARARLRQGKSFQLKGFRF